MFNIGEFSARVSQRGFLQNNKYDVKILFDKNVMAGSFLSSSNLDGVAMTDVARDLSYRCVNASLPGIALKTADVNRFGLGVQEKMPYSGNFTDVSLSFLCDKYGAAYNFWYAWINYIFQSVGQTTNNGNQSTKRRPYYTTAYKDDYCATIVITVYDTTGESAIEHVLFKAFPTSINDISVGWNNNNQLIKITTNITFREWSLEGGDTSLDLPAGTFGAIVPTQSPVPQTSNLGTNISGKSILA